MATQATRGAVRLKRKGRVLLGLLLSIFAHHSLLAQSQIPSFDTSLDAGVETGASVPAEPTPDPIFRIENILVKGTGQGSADARARAIELAHIAALRAVVDRLTSSQDRFKIRLPQLSELTALVQEVKIKDQRLTETALVGLMDITFSKERVKAYLAEEGISFSLTKSKPMLVLPILKHQGQVYGFDARNPWFRVWEKSVLPTGLIDFKTPETENAFRALTIASENANEDQIKDLVAVDGAGSLLVSVASFDSDETGALVRLNVDTRRMGSNIGDRRHIYTGDVEFGERPEEALARAAQDIAAAYNEAWRSRSSTQIVDELAEIEFESPVDGLDGWLQLESTLRGLGLVERVDLVALTDERVEASLRFNGTLDQFASVLSAQGYDLLPSLNRFIILLR